MSKTGHKQMSALSKKTELKAKETQRPEKEMRTMHCRQGQFLAAEKQTNKQTKAAAESESGTGRLQHRTDVWGSTQGRSVQPSTVLLVACLKESVGQTCGQVVQAGMVAHQSQ